MKETAKIVWGCWLNEAGRGETNGKGENTVFLSEVLKPKAASCVFVREISRLNYPDKPWFVHWFAAYIESRRNKGGFMVMLITEFWMMV